MATHGFWRAAAARPEHPAVIEASGTVTTYGALRERVDRLSHVLRDRGTGTNSTVSVLLPNGVELLALQLAALQIGANFTPVNRHLTAGETAYILQDSNATVFVSHERYAKVARHSADEAGIPERGRLSVGTVDGFAGLSGLGKQFSGPVTDRTAGALLYYSSGTTGRPKGIRRQLTGLSPEEDARNQLDAMFGVFGLGPDDVNLSLAPLYHAAPNSMALLSLHAGNTVVLAERFDPEQSLALAEKHRVTWGFLVPTMFHRWLALPESVRRSYDLSAFRTMLHSGAPCPVETKRALIDWLGPVPIEFYGSTESGMVAMIRAEEWAEHPRSVGQALPGKEFKIFDEEGNELPAGEPGLIHVRGSRPFDYLGDAARTASCRRGDFYAPGDIGYLDADGRLFMCDRRTDLIISGGVNIYPAEIEGELLQHPAVSDAVVIGVPHPEWGHTVTALVSLYPGHSVTPEELEAHSRDRLAGFKVPRRIEFREEIPRTAAGKINRGRVREEYLARAV
ncbi:AMP-binding protein [Streptomyces sp. NPDC102451]|uniref:AMP-binding protein n=1 Tax=Streptomyces sp. NPDC102451 TaxID=3366177 RepID=UPI003830A8C8